jgi:cell pole-organizing protein PopZ
MEEILASIRRIIADDDAAKGPAPAPEPVKLPPVAVVPPPPPAPPVEQPVANENLLDEMLAELNAAPQPEPEPIPEPVADVLDLTEAMAEELPSPPPAFRTIDGQSDIVFEDGPAEPEPPRLQFQVRERGPLMSAATSAAVDSAFNSLAHTVLVQNARTLEDLVKEMLQPLLKTWLDDNLPGLVERLVRSEIERVSRGRR